MKICLSLLACAAIAAVTLAACSGGGSSAMPNMPFQSMASPTPTPTPAPTPTVLILGTGFVTGLDDQFTPNDGDTATGGVGQTVDTIKCEPMVSTYHVHAHLTIFVNGVRYAIPDAIGIVGPGPESAGFISTGTCFYHLHSHDADGYVHIEAPAVTTFTLGQYFDIWGQTLSTSNVAGFAGSVKAYTAQAPTGNLIASTFVLYTGDPRNIDLVSHEEIVLEVGPTFVTPPYIPPVKFYTEF